MIVRIFKNFSGFQEINMKLLGGGEASDRTGDFTTGTNSASS